MPMVLLKKLRDLVKYCNGLIDAKLAPTRTNLMGLYRDAIGTCDRSAVLHIGSGRDKYNLESTASHPEGVCVAFDMDTNGLSLNNMSVRVRGDASRLPFQTNTFSLVFSEYTFEHLVKPWDVLSEIDRVLNPQGSVVILVPNRNHYYTFVTRFTPFWFHRWWLNVQGVQEVDIDTFPTRHRWGSISDFQRSAVLYGWEVYGLHSTPGPTGYTRWLPIHSLFTVVDRILSRWRTNHLAYVVHFVKTDAKNIERLDGSAS